MAEIYNQVSNTLITGTAYADSITNSGDGVTINALASGDTIINTGASVSISGGAGEDSIRNYGTKGTISAGDGDDYIDNTFLADSVAIDASAGDDMIYAASSYLTINAGTGDDSIYVQATTSGTTQGGLRNSILGGAGADTIENEGKQTTIDGGAGSDYIDNTELAGNNVIRGGAGADFIYNSAASVTIDAGEDNDYIDNFEGNVTISAGAGADTVYNSYGSSVSISGGDGNDSIHNAPHSDNATITAGAGADTIINRSDSALIDGGAGNDRIQNGDSDDYSPYGVNSTISGGAGSDTISNIRASVSIGGGADNDSIRNTASNVTITGGAGADTVYNVGSNVLIQYTSGDGNDIINDLSTTSTLSIAGAAYTSVQSGDDLIIGVGTGSITLVDAASLSTVNIIGTLSGGDSTDSGTLQGTSGNDSLEIVHEEISWTGGVRQTIYSAIYGLAGDDTLENLHYIYVTSERKNNVIMDGGTGNDLINNYGANSKLTGGDGNDYIVNHGDNVSISGGSGNDTIDNDGDNVSINAGDGDNSIDNSGTNVTLDALGNGNDSVYNTGNGLTINTGAGNNHVYNSGATLSITAGDGNDDIINDGSNVTINAGAGNNSIIAGGSNAIINTGAGNDSIRNNSNNSSISTGDGSDTIRNYGDNSSISTGAGNDSIDDSSDNSSISTGAGNDSIDVIGDNVTISGGAGDDTIYNIRGEGENILIQYASGDGNDSITGFNATSTISIDGAAYTSIQSGSDIVLGVGTGSITLVDAADLSIVNIIGTLSGGSDTQETAVNITNTTSNTVVTGSAYGDTITNRASNVTINAQGGNDIITNNYTTSPDNVSISGGAGADTIENAGDNSTVLGGAGNDTIENTGDTVQIDAGAGNDSVYSHCQDVTISGAGGNDTIVIGGDNHLVQYSSGDGNDLIQGFRANSSISISGSAYTSLASGSNIILGVGNSSITLDGAASLSTVNIIGTLDGGDTTPAGTGVTVDSTANDTMITGTAYADSIVNSGVRVTIQALAGNDYIANVVDSSVTTASLGNSIDAGAGNDTIYNYHTYNPTLLGGAGNDSIVVQRGHKILANGGDGNDSIIGLQTTEESSWAMGGYATLYGGAGNDYISPGYTNNSMLDGGSGNDTIIMTGADSTITGNRGNDVISLGNADSVNVQINYANGDGNDTVIGFTDNDTLSLGDNVYSTQQSGNDLIITVGDSKITLVDAASLSNPNIESTNEAVNMVEILLKRTAAGYPIASGILLNPEELIGEEPDNYATKEDWSITSADNLKLHGICYTPENSNDKWVVLVHGYGLKLESMYPFATFYLANNYNVLMIDQRAAGKSEGVWLTMGAAESQDVALWTQEIARRNSNAKITLHGVSMGSATAILAAARSDAVNVTSLVEDCGYTSAIKLFYLINNNYNLGVPDEVVAALDSVGHGMMGYYLHDAAPIDSITSAKMPTLFISGDDDGVVPVSMLSELYDASGAEVKEKFVVKGAGHAQAGLNDPVGYNNAVFRFVAEANGEGWSTENIFDNISLRGTKYNDTLANSGDQVTINAGAGDDFISLDGASNVINYADGDGNDTITGFNDTSTISISGAAYSSMQSGNDVILTIGDGKVTLTDAATLDTLNIVVTIDGGDTTPADKGVNINNTVDAILLTGTAYNDTIVNSGERVTIDALGGDDYIANVVDSSVTAASLGNSISAGDGNDTIYNYHTYNPTLDGGNGDDSIVVSNGHLTYIDGGAGADTILGVSESIQSDDWSMGGHATIYGGEGDDYINPGYTNDSSIDGGTGNDTIRTNGANATIDGGTGNNLIQITTTEEGVTGQYVVMNGKTTVENFGTGFGSLSDTVLIAGDAPAVDFKSDGLTFYSGDKSLTLSDVTTTARVNIYYAAWDELSRGVYIADDDWYSVTDSELNTTENLHYVGATAKVNHGLNFGAVTGSLNMTIDTDYNPGHDFYVNNVYSIRGGAGNTTITGSAKSDTIIAGTGSTTLNAGAGGDILSGNGKTTFNIDSGATTTVNGAAGDSLNVADDSLTFLSDGTAYIVNGTLRSVSDNTALESDDGGVITGSNLEHATIINGESASLTSADRELVIGKNGASLKGYTLDKAFIRNEADAATIIDLINATDSSQLVLDSGTFYTKNQKPIVLEDYDTSDGTFVNIKTADGRKTIFGWSPLNGGLVDGNSIDKPQVIFGDAPNGNSIIRGGNRNDSIYAGAKDVVSLSGGHDELHINDETSHGVTVDMGDGSAQSRTRIIDGFDVTRDLLKIDSPENINARILDGSLQFIKGDSRVTFDELATFDDANGLQVQVDGRTYELRNDYDSGLKDVDYFWTDTDGNYYLTDSTFRIHDDGSTREYFIAEGSGRLTIDGFNFGRDKDKLNLTTINGLKTYGDNLYIESGDSDVVEVTGGAGKTIDVKLDGTTYTAQLGKHLTYDLNAEYYGDLQGGTGCAISVGADFAQEEVAIYLNEEEEADGKVRYYGGVTKIDASAFTGQASLVGSEFNDKIIAAQGATSLWGGEAGDDELFGTGSDNSFFYCKGNGDDKIYNAANGDEVNLVDIRLEDITNSIISDGAVTLELSDGGRLTVMNSADVTFNLGDGTSWKADRQSKEWQQQA